MTHLIERFRNWLMPVRLIITDDPELEHRVESLEEEAQERDQRLGRVEARVGIRNPKWWDQQRGAG